MPDELSAFARLVELAMPPSATRVRATAIHLLREEVERFELDAPTDPSLGRFRTWLESLEALEQRRQARRITRRRRTHPVVFRGPRRRRDAT